MLLNNLKSLSEIDFSKTILKTNKLTQSIIEAKESIEYDIKNNVENKNSSEDIEDSFDKNVEYISNLASAQIKRTAQLNKDMGDLTMKLAQTQNDYYKSRQDINSEIGRLYSETKDKYESTKREYDLMNNNKKNSAVDSTGSKYIEVMVFEAAKRQKKGSDRFKRLVDIAKSASSLTFTKKIDLGEYDWNGKDANLPEKLIKALKSAL